MAPQETFHLRNLLSSYEREKILIEQHFENRVQPIYRAIQGARNADEVRNIGMQLSREIQERDREIQRINQKIEETKLEINRNLL
jgi:hypothetical protein